MKEVLQQIADSVERDLLEDTIPEEVSALVNPFYPQSARGKCHIGTLLFTKRAVAQGIPLDEISLLLFSIPRKACSHVAAEISKQYIVDTTIKQYGATLSTVYQSRETYPFKMKDLHRLSPKSVYRGIDF